MFLYHDYQMVWNESRYQTLQLNLTLYNLVLHLLPSCESSWKASGVALNHKLTNYAMTGTRGEKVDTILFMYLLLFYKWKKPKMVNYYNSTGICYTTAGLGPFSVTGNMYEWQSLIDWLIDWLDRVLRRIGNISAI